MEEGWLCLSVVSICSVAKQICVGVGGRGMVVSSVVSICSVAKQICVGGVGKRDGCV